MCSNNGKIILSFLQVAPVLVSFVDLTFPSAFQTFLNQFRFLALNLIPLSSFKCALPLDYYSKLIVTLAFPAIVLCLVSVLPVAVLRLRNRFDFSDSTDDRHRRRLYSFKFVKTGVFSLFLMYPTVSSAAVSFFLCRQINGVWYLVVCRPSPRPFRLTMSCVLTDRSFSAFLLCCLTGQFF
jgi:hypothetical protein